MPYETQATRQMAALAERDGGWFCRYCGCELYSVADGWVAMRSIQGRGPQFPTRDHVIPRKLGGSNKLDNLVLACTWCNCRKGVRLVVFSVAGQAQGANER